MQTLESRIDGMRVLVVVKPATTSTILFARIIKYFGVGIAKFIANAKNNSSKDPDGNASDIMDKEINFLNFVDAISDISDKVDPEIFLSLIQDIVQGSRVQQSDSANEMIEVTNNTFDIVFTGKPMFMYKVVFLNLKVNYGDFLAIGGTGTIQATTMSPAQSNKKK